MILGIIPARKGSSLKNKNYHPLCGKPLYMWTVEAAIGSDLVNQWIISTNDPNINCLMGRYLETIQRPDNLCQDDSPIEECLKYHIQKWEKEEGKKISYVVMCLPNVPVRKPGMIDRCINHLQEHPDLDSVISVTTPRHHPEWMKISSGKILEDYISYLTGLSGRGNNYRRQDLPPVFIGDGAVHVIERDILMNTPVGTQHGWLGNYIGFIWQEEEYGIEIDSKLDLLLAEAVLKEQLKK